MRSTTSLDLVLQSLGDIDVPVVVAAAVVLVINGGVFVFVVVLESSVNEDDEWLDLLVLSSSPCFATRKSS